MENLITCEIVTPERLLYKGEASFVAAPAAGGEIGVLPQHSPFVSTLKAGEIRIKTAGSKEAQRFVIAGGYVEVKDNRVIVLADHARDVFDVDTKAVQERLDKALAKLAETEEGTEYYTFLEEEIEWYRAQLHLVG